MFPDLLLSDTLALDLGIANASSDQALKVVLKKATNEVQDKKLWELLPVLYLLLKMSVLCCVVLCCVVLCCVVLCCVVLCVALSPFF
jgi:hypothetical protein